MRDELWDICTASLLLAAVAEAAWLWSLGCVVTGIFVATFGVLPAFGLFWGPRRGE